MGQSWSEGYFTDTGYTYGYYRETSPVYQRFCLLLRGLAYGDPDGHAAHCELGFGQGVSININAASNLGQYVGTDFNPAHACHARELAGHTGGDLRLYDESFEQLLARDDLPQFDSISLHGIWTWVGHENHRNIVKFAARHLRPGGVFYISYNCFPGWAPAYPLRQLFMLHHRYAPGSPDTSQRIDDTLKFTWALLAANPLFARATIGLDDRLKTIARLDRNYLAHEYFNREWNCMYFTEVADTLGDAKLEFATTAEPLDVVDAINLTADGIAFLDSVEHPILREQLRDYFVNRQFRKDLYLRGTRRLSPAEQRELTLKTRIILEHPVDEIPMQVTVAHGKAALHEDIFHPIIDELARLDYAPKSFGDLMRALPAFQLPVLVTACAVLVGAGHAAPCQAESTVSRVHETCKALNFRLIERARTRDDVNYLASPVTGGGVAVGRFQQLFLLSRHRGCDEPDGWARFAWQILSDQGQNLFKEGKVLETLEENLAELTFLARSFVERRLPILKAAKVF